MSFLDEFTSAECDRSKGLTGANLQMCQQLTAGLLSGSGIDRLTITGKMIATLLKM